MTREFDKQRRNDSRPSFRNSSSNRNRDERPSRPPRARLNRETVDRAWETGAQQHHADYRPRTGQSGYYGQAPRPNGRRTNFNNSRSEYSSQNGRGGNRPYGNRQENYRDNRQGNYRENTRNFERPFNDTSGPRSRSFDSDRRNSSDFRDWRFNDRRNSYNGPNASNGRQRFQDRNHERYQDRNNQRGDFRRNERPSRNPNDTRPQRNTAHPRWQTRPAAYRNEQSFRNDEQFEGDYERFEGQDRRPARSFERPSQGNRETRNNRDNSRGGRYSDQDVPQERHVTRLPDGRVLKGSRPAQRKQAQFWTGVSEETGDLLNQVQVPSSKNDEGDFVAEDGMEATDAQEMAEPIEAANAEEVDVGPSEEQGPTATTPRRRTRAASAVTRAKRSPQTDATGPRPSQRGFKWPTQE